VDSAVVGVVAPAARPFLTASRASY